ncbi:UbiD family decarboxylase [Paenibacillus segetis]|uniref:Menaquinone biosynthesis decarboxylase n=1 Tax=Paenibacillus segetis TaxID=1325360 RepID=A0ABQ1YQ71_9BACL|nr:UbiD family decarboxylase [Paenibacillus segetis]GGH34601.1 menaquinone biosynthesis decarboxylase [Paenibacillus segetis]
MSYKNLRGWLDALLRENDLAIIDVPVDPYLELAEIHRRVIDDEGPALLFTNVKGSSFPVATNLLGTRRRVEMAFGSRPEELTNRFIGAMNNLLPPTAKALWNERGLIRDMLTVGMKTVPHAEAPILQACRTESPLRELPRITNWHRDAGSSLTLPLVYTENPNSPKQCHMSMNRIQLYDDHTTGVHWEMQKGGGYHYYEAEKRGEALPVSIFLGGPPALIASASAPVPEILSELLMTSFILGEKLPMVDNPLGGHQIPAELEFAITGLVPPHERRLEGPFGNSRGYYSLKQEFPVLHVNHMWHRKNAIYPATVMGKPYQEDYYLGQFLQKLLSPAFPILMPRVRSLWTYAECGFQTLTSAVVRESYSREALISGFQILGQRELSLTKFLMLTDKMIVLSDFKLLLATVLERFNPCTDLYIFSNMSNDILDYTGREQKLGSKAILVGVGEPIRALPKVYDEGDIPEVDQIKVFHDGCLVVSGASYENEPMLPQRLLTTLKERGTKWPLVILVDHAEIVANDQMALLWTVFTRFNPTDDIYSVAEINQHHLAYSLPLIIDARMKPGYQDELFPSEEVVSLVDQRWKTYFA